MEFGPILRALARNRTSALLVAAQFALALTVCVNSLFIIHQRMERMNMPTGLDAEHIVVVETLPVVEETDPHGIYDRERDVLRGLPGVNAVSVMAGVPQYNAGWDSTFREANKDNAGEYEAAVLPMDEHGLAALGVNLIEGRSFRADEVIRQPPGGGPSPNVAIITQALAKRMFGATSALGKRITDDGVVKTVVGVVETLHAMDMGAGSSDERGENSVLLPEINPGVRHDWVLRIDGDPEAMLKLAEDRLNAANPERYVYRHVWLKDQIRENQQRDRSMITVLVVTMLLIILVTVGGIVGMNFFNVHRRYKQIGTRRALGATRGRILRYFLTENTLIAGFGLTLGVAGSIALNIWLGRQFSLPPLPIGYPLLGVIGLWLMAILGSLVPAWRAAQISPATATRSV